MLYFQVRRGVADTLEKPPRSRQTSPCQVNNSGGGVVPVSRPSCGSGRFRLSAPTPRAAGLPKKPRAKQPQEGLLGWWSLAMVSLWSDSLNKGQFLYRGLQTGREV